MYPDDSILHEMMQGKMTRSRKHSLSELPMYEVPLVLQERVGQGDVRKASSPQRSLDSAGPEEFRKIKHRCLH